MHVLLSITRPVPAGQLQVYELSWRRLRAAAGDVGVHAWRFRSAVVSEPTRYLEFLEWRADRDDPTATGPLREALAELGDTLPGEAETWHELAGEPSQERAP